MKYKLMAASAALGLSLAAIAGAPARNTFLAAEKYAITHFDSSQSDAFPYKVKQGEVQTSVEASPRVLAGPVNIMTLASTSPNFMWAVGSQGVKYIDVSNGDLKELASFDIPGTQKIPDEAFKKGLQTQFKNINDVKKVVKDWKVDWTRIANGVYSLVDNENKLYYNTFDSRILVFKLKDPKNPASGIELESTKDLSKMLTTKNEITGKENIAGLSLTYDGKLVVVTTNRLLIMERDLSKELANFQLEAGETISNSIAIDEKNGIYVASDMNMRKLVWNGTKLSVDEKDGGWVAAYDFGKQPNSVKFGKGTGSTPTLMGFGKDEDKLVVITDGADQMKVTAFWRDQIPQDAKMVEGAKSNRIAGQFQVTGGLNPLPKFIQSEQSVVVNNYGAFVVNNIRKKGDKDRLVDVLAGGPIFDPPTGMERVEWDPKKNAFSSVWTRNDVVSTSMVPTVSTGSGIVFVNGYTKQDGWEVTGLDWNSGKTVHRTIFGQSNFGNGAYALIQFLENGDMMFNSIGGATRVQYSKLNIKQAEEAKE